MIARQRFELGYRYFLAERRDQQMRDMIGARRDEHAADEPAAAGVALLGAALCAGGAGRRRGLLRVGRDEALGLRADGSSW